MKVIELSPDSKFAKQEMCGVEKPAKRKNPARRIEP
jgi:hypothetical protein